jgi:SAM-dependent methyltransferase|tara:strand:+ start:2868 stop:3542 length:675 start_codon:yes stop_codon:yes gene_type:complete
MNNNDIDVSKKNNTTEKEYWDNYYNVGKDHHYPSSFSKFCLENYLIQPSKILDLGCGNARDSFYFAKNGHNVVGIDYSTVVIDQNCKLSKELNLSGSTTFKASSFSIDLQNYIDFNAVYSRFSMHTISYNEQQKVTNDVYRLLVKGGLFFIECRTINDFSYLKGKKLSEFERYTDHYRRFIDSTNFLSELIQKGFVVKFFCESKDLAVLDSENPIVARYVLEKF